MDISKLWVVAVVSNPVRYQTRYKLFKAFEKHMQDSGVNLLIVEQAFGVRPFEITKPNNKNHVRIRTFHELWHKENMINIGMNRIPDPDWEYMAWIDADIMFNRPDWAIECVHQLQHYMVIQMFSEAIDLGPDYQVLDRHQGFVKSYIENDMYPNTPQKKGYYYFKNQWHPGYAWAARREALEELGGLIDWAILGAGDHHMAMALIGEAEKNLPKGLHERYVKKVLMWQDRAIRLLNRDIGYMPGTISHFFHGKKKNRKYTERWKILVNNGFDPDSDLKRDTCGLWQLTGNNWRLRDEIRLYFKSRNEDDPCV